MKSVVIVAGGKSTRFGTDKLQQNLFDKSVLQQTVDTFLPIVDEVVVVGCQIPNTVFAQSGKTRFLSVVSGLNAVSKNCDVVAIHDGARPFVGKNLVKDLFEQAKLHGSAVPSLPVTDTIWFNNGNLAKVDRSSLLSVQTPQVFDYKLIMQAVRGASDNDYTDESTLFFDTFGDVNFVRGQKSNGKITFSTDLPQYKVGNGFDVHAFGNGDGVIIGGVKIPFEKSLVGHSDADVLTHAVCDAVLSASGNLDIGHQFPDTDDTYLNANSIKLLEKCLLLACKSGFEVVNVSAVVICQQPKIAPYIESISSSLAKVLQVPTTCVNITATTTEHLGALGNGDGIACQCTCLVKNIL